MWRLAYHRQIWSVHHNSTQNDTTNKSTKGALPLFNGCMNYDILTVQSTEGGQPTAIGNMVNKYHKYSIVWKKSHRENGVSSIWSSKSRK